MRSRKIQSGTTFLLMLLLLAAAGCTVSVQPWTKPTPPVPPPYDPLLGSPHSPAGFKAPMPNTYPTNPYPPGTYPPGNYPPGNYPPGGYPPNAGATNESLSQLYKQLNETEDQRKALVDQVQMLKKLAKERDDNLQHASYEMDESAKQLKRTREEVRQFGADMDDLRERVKKLEELRSVLRPLMDEITYHLDREKDSAKLPRIPPPTK